MGFDVEALRSTVADHGRVVRVVIADLRGSSPREVGAAMLVWENGQSGTIGGGTLEYEAAASARRQSDAGVVSQHALGPDLGQCCGGAVTLLSEIYDADHLPSVESGVIARPVAPTASATPMSMAATRVLAQARSLGQVPQAQMIDGWMIEPEHRPGRQVWIWGAGHVGRAMAAVFAPLPDVQITWVDTAATRFPESVPSGVTVVPAVNPADLVGHAPIEAEHLIVTYSHALDLELCHRLLQHGFGFAGLIGSKTKWARFRSRLAGLGHGDAQISRITCPIGDPGLGKHPQTIALGVAAHMLRPAFQPALREDIRA